MSMVRLAAWAVVVASAALPVGAQGIPKAQSPEEVGFMASRLKRLSDRIEEGVKNNELPGAVVLIARNGKLVMFDSFGFRDHEAKAPMTNDTIFRIASMTKPIVSGRRYDAGRGGQAHPGRSGVALHSGLRRYQGRRREEEGRRHGRDRARAAGPGR